MFNGITNGITVNNPHSYSSTNQGHPDLVPFHNARSQGGDLPSCSPSSESQVCGRDHRARQSQHLQHSSVSCTRLNSQKSIGRCLHVFGFGCAPMAFGIGALVTFKGGRVGQISTWSILIQPTKQGILSQPTRGY